MNRIHSIQLLHYLTACLAVITLVSCAQTFYRSKISPKIRDIVARISDRNGYFGPLVDEGGHTNQYQDFKLLGAQAADSELVELTNHPNAAVRCHAFWALSNRQFNGLLPIIVKHINDTESVEILNGCEPFDQYVGDFMISKYRPQDNDSFSNQLDSGEAWSGDMFLIYLPNKKLDSILIYTSNKLRATTIAIRRASPNVKLYIKTKELYVKEKNQSALVALAKFRKEQDIALILNNRDPISTGLRGYLHTYQAISEFPHPDFMPFLEAKLLEIINHTNRISEYEFAELFQAIARYKNPKALELLSLALDRVQREPERDREWYTRNIRIAVEASPDTLYDELYWRLWEKENNVTPKIVKYLYSRNPDRAWSLTQKSLKDSVGIKNASIEIDYNRELPYNTSNDTTNLLSLMLDSSYRRDPVRTIALIDTNLLYADVFLFPIFAQQVLKINHESFVPLIFQRLESEKNAHVYLCAFRTLIEFKSSEINKQILAAIPKNKALIEDWGGVELRYLLRSNGIK